MLISTATIGSTPYLTVSKATTTPAEPTERSKFRVTISITALIAASATIDVCNASRIRLRWLRKMLFVAT